LRDKTHVRGCAVIVEISQQPGQKRRHRCPSCGKTTLKERHTQLPRFRCECGATFDEPVVQEEDCILYEARFGNSFHEIWGTVALEALWSLAPRLNKQLAMLELDTDKTATLLARVPRAAARPDDLPLAAQALFSEGSRTAVLVNRYERDPRARAACISHYGSQCVACGFSFAERYGEVGDGVIEVHHLEPLGAQDGLRDVDPIEHLRPLCSNCHTMAHRRSPPYSVEELQTMLVRSRVPIT
jgi:hypothetical protein